MPPLQVIANIMLENQWPFHALCVFMVLAIRVWKLRGFLELFGTAVVLFIVALGNAINVEQLLVAPANTLTESTTVGLKSLALVSVVIYGSIAANLVVVAVTHEQNSRDA